VLALQGAFSEHAAMLRCLGARVVEVRQPQQLAEVDGLVMPGGESTTMGLVAERWGLVAPLKQWVQAGKPVWGTCAGMILLAEHAVGQKQGGQPLIGGLGVTVSRNYFGRQNQSFEALLSAPLLGAAPFRALFIRAPAILAAEPQVEVLARAPGHGEQVIVAVRQGPILATAFHPELTADPRWHQLFLTTVREHSAGRTEASAVS
jgi:5'-phosphate synthase pdxT subunit